MPYVDAFAAAVPTANREAYIAHASKAADVFKKHGALRYMENWGSDVPDGETTSFPLAVKCGSDETVVVGWAVWPDKATRDTGMQAAMSDPDMQMGSMPFDGKRLIFGGFETIVER